MQNITCATLTFHRTTNYGALFQTYALQKALEIIGIESEVLDYRCPTIERRYDVNPFLYFLNLKNLLKTIIRNSYVRDNRRKFVEFFEQYIRKSATVYTPATVASSNSKYDHFIVGSDQVWNPECMGNDSNFFLSFADSRKKNSYAASFGWTEFTSDQKNWFNGLLHDFANISVRESSGQKIVKACINREPAVVLDPTLLLHKEWCELANTIPRVCNEKYVVIYLMKETDSIFKRAKNYAKSHNLKVVYINDRLIPKIGVINKFYTSPIEWLNLFYHSEGVFTNSFHGTAFATNFNKHLWVELLPEPSKSNSRLIDFLSAVGMKGCIIPKKELNIVSQIDYRHANRSIEEYRNNSITYLKNIFAHE